MAHTINRALKSKPMSIASQDLAVPLGPDRVPFVPRII